MGQGGALLKRQKAFFLKYQKYVSNVRDNFADVSFEPANRRSNSEFLSLKEHSTGLLKAVAYNADIAPFAIITECICHSGSVQL